MCCKRKKNTGKLVSLLKLQTLSGNIVSVTAGVRRGRGLWHCLTPRSQTEGRTTPRAKSGRARPRAPAPSEHAHSPEPRGGAVRLRRGRSWCPAGGRRCPGRLRGRVNFPRVQEAGAQPPQAQLVLDRADS